MDINKRISIEGWHPSKKEQYGGTGLARRGEGCETS